MKTLGKLIYLRLGCLSVVVVLAGCASFLSYTNHYIEPSSNDSANVIIYREKNFVGMFNCYSIGIDKSRIEGWLCNKDYSRIKAVPGKHIIEVSAPNFLNSSDKITVNLNPNEWKFVFVQVTTALMAGPSNHLLLSDKDQFLDAMKEAGTPVPPDLLEELKSEQSKPATTQHNPPATSMVEPAAENGGKSLNK